MSIESIKQEMATLQDEITGLQTAQNEDGRLAVELTERAEALLRGRTDGLHRSGGQLQRLTREAHELREQASQHQDGFSAKAREIATRQARVRALEAEVTWEERRQAAPKDLRKALDAVHEREKQCKKEYEKMQRELRDTSAKAMKLNEHQLNMRSLRAVNEVVAEDRLAEGKAEEARAADAEAKRLSEEIEQAVRGIRGLERIVGKLEARVKELAAELQTFPVHYLRARLCTAALAVNAAAPAFAKVLEEYRAAESELLGDTLDSAERLERYGDCVRSVAPLLQCVTALPVLFIGDDMPKIKDGTAAIRENFFWSVNPL